MEEFIPLMVLSVFVIIAQILMVKAHNAPGQQDEPEIPQKRISLGLQFIAAGLFAIFLGLVEKHFLMYVVLVLSCIPIVKMFMLGGSNKSNHENANDDKSRRKRSRD